MQEEFISKPVVMAALLWGQAVGLVLVTWLLAWWGVDLEWIIAVAVTAILSMAIAVVWQVRLFVLRLGNLVRVATGLDSPRGELHTIDGRERTR